MAHPRTEGDVPLKQEDVLEYLLLRKHVPARHSEVSERRKRRRPKGRECACTSVFSGVTCRGRPQQSIAPGTQEPGRGPSLRPRGAPPPTLSDAPKGSFVNKAAGKRTPWDGRLWGR